VHIFIYIHYTKVLANSRGLHTRTVIFTHSETNKNCTSNYVSSSARAQWRQLARAPVICKQHLIGWRKSPLPPHHLSALLARNVFVLTRCVPER